MADRMTLREHYAGMAMQGLASGNPSAHLGLSATNAHHTAIAAVMLADALITVLTKQSLE
jgi:hypothetical protein